MEIKFNNVSYLLNGNTILSNVDLNIKTNSITGIIGKSGSGKTTLLELIDMLLFPTEGKISIENIDIIKNTKIKQINELKYKIGMVFQFPEEQFFSSTVKKELEFGLNYIDKDLSKIEKHVIDAMEMVDLPLEYLDKNPFILSNGEKKKVAIASILAINPNVIIFDEPTMGLDNKSKTSLIKLLRLLKSKYNKTIIIVSNDTDLIHQLCDQVIVLNDGQVVLSGNKYDVFTNNLEQYGLKKPKIIEFEQLVFKEKGVKLLYRDDINDLMKDVYRCVK